MFVSFEGIDGSGKSTQARRLAETLRARGRAVTLTREPGGSPGAEEIRGLLLTGAAARWSPVTEVLLFTAARRDHLEATIRPALARGEVVITDRFADSTRAYQGVGRDGAPPLRDLVDRLHAEVIGVEPDLTLLIDIDPGIGLARAAARGGEARFEAMGVDLQHRLRAAFLAIAAGAPARVRVIDGAQAPDAVSAAVLLAFDAAGG